MPAARADEQGRDLLVQLVLLALRTLERNGAAHGVAQIDLPVERAGPRGRVGVFEIGHVRLRARVQRVNDHLAVHRAGDLDPAVLHVRGHGRHAPVVLANLPGLGGEVRQVAGINGRLALLASFKQFEATRVERAL